MLGPLGGRLLRVHLRGFLSLRDHRGCRPLCAALLRGLCGAPLRVICDSRGLRVLVLDVVRFAMVGCAVRLFGAVATFLVAIDRRGFFADELATDLLTARLLLAAGR